MRFTFQRKALRCFAQDCLSAGSPSPSPFQEHRQRGGAAAMTTLVETSEEEPTMAVARAIAEVAWHGADYDVSVCSALLGVALLCLLGEQGGRSWSSVGQLNSAVFGVRRWRS